MRIAASLDFKIIWLPHPDRQKKVFDSKHNFGRKMMRHFKILNERHKTGGGILNLK
jgi:hypothetical protein